MPPARAAERGRIGQQVAAILFDFGGTLDGTSPWKDRMFRLCRAEGVAVTPEEFDTAFYRVDDALVGALPATLSLDETVRRLVAGLDTALDLSDAVADRIARRFTDDTTAEVQSHIPLLSELSSRYDLGLVSNFYGNLSQVCDDLGLGAMFGVIVDSTAVGWTKPDPRIFTHALDALGLACGQATFVGDSPSRDMAGARGIGMDHIWLAGTASSRPEPCCPGDSVIGSLGELRRLLL